MNNAKANQNHGSQARVVGYRETAGNRKPRLVPAFRLSVQRENALKIFEGLRLETHSRVRYRAHPERSDTRHRLVGANCAGAEANGLRVVPASRTCVCCANDAPTK